MLHMFKSRGEYCGSSEAVALSPLYSEMLWSPTLIVSHLVFAMFYKQMNRSRATFEKL